MLKIYVNNKEVDLGELKAITLKYNGGIFDFEDIQGSYSLPFSLPLSDINRAIFDYPYRIPNNNNEIREYPSEVWHSGVKMVEGDLSASVFKNKSISCNNDIDNGGLFKKLKGITLDKQYYGGAKPFVWKNPEYDFLTDDYLLYPVENQDFFDGTVNEERWREDTWFRFSNQNTYDPVLPQFYELLEERRPTGEFPFYLDAPTPAITPFPLLWRTLKYLFENLGFEYTDDFFTQDDYNTLTIFNVNNAVTTESYTELGIKKERNILNEVDIANHLPKMDSAEFMKALQSFFNISFHISNFSIKIVDRLAMIKSTVFRDITTKIVNTYDKNYIETANDGISVNVLRDENDDNVKGWPDINEFPSSEIVDDLQSYNASPSQVVLNFSVNGKIYYQFISLKELNPSAEYNEWEFRQYPIVWGPGGSHDLYFRQNGYYVENKEFQVNTNMTSVPEMIYDRINIFFPARIPKVRQKGNSFLNSFYNEFTLRLLYYNGIQEAQVDSAHDVNSSNDQPIASDNLNGKELNAYWSYKNRWEEFFTWWEVASKLSFNMDIQFSATEIKDFDYSEKQKIGGNLYFIKSFDVQLTREEVKPAKCILIKSD